MATTRRAKPADGSPNRGKGRPSKCTAALTERYVQAVKAGLLRRHAAHACGVTPESVELWMARAEAGHGGQFAAFRRAVLEAEAKRAEQLAGLILRQAVDAPERTDAQGTVLQRARRGDWRAAAWLLENTGEGVTRVEIARRVEASERAALTHVPDVVDAEELGEDADEVTVLRHRLTRLRRQQFAAEQAGNHPAVAALTRQVVQAEDRLRAVRAEADEAEPGELDPARMDETRFRHELEVRARDIPEDHLAIFAREWLTRHRLVAVPDASATNRLLESDDP